MIKQQSDSSPHPFADHSNRFATDTLLRRHGYKILSRPSNQLATWTRDGKEILTVKQALQQIDRKAVSEAKKREQEYLEQI